MEKKIETTMMGFTRVIYTHWGSVGIMKKVETTVMCIYWDDLPHQLMIPQCMITMIMLGAK